ncbi:hypothetical protein AC249_AIPGENE5777 [Exaiptasia diaphana]|nr:hypothetical protein AC249_AIPGENE5777 [Exaiptasia diaphana]
MVNEEAESYDTVTIPQRRSSSSSSGMSVTQDDVLMDLETKRFDKRPTTPQRRVSCISSFGRRPSFEGAPARRESFGGRRFSVDLSRPRLSPQFKRDKVLNKLFFDMDVSTRKVGEDTGALVHDLEVVQTSNLTIGKRIDNLLFAASEMRDGHRHIFTQVENVFVPRRGK